MPHEPDASVTLGAMVKQKQPEREQLASDIEAFIVRGGEVQQLDPGASSLDELSTKQERTAAALARWRGDAV